MYELGAAGTGYNLSQLLVRKYIRLLHKLSGIPVSFLSNKNRANLTASGKSNISLFMRNHLCLPCNRSDLHADGGIGIWPGSAPGSWQTATRPVYIRWLESASYILVEELQYWQIQVEQAVEICAGDD